MPEDWSVQPSQLLKPGKTRSSGTSLFGLTNEEIARSLGIGVETVKKHVQKMLRKLKLPDRTAAAI